MPTIIKNNVAIGCGRDGFRIGAGSDFILENNIAKGCGGQGFNVIQESNSSSNFLFSSWLREQGLPPDFDFPSWMRRHRLPETTNPVALAELCAKLRATPVHERISLILRSQLMKDLASPTLDIPFMVEFLIKSAQSEPT